MEFQIDTESLKNGLNKVLTVVDKKSTRPILAYTLFNIKKDSLELIASDLEVSVKIILSSYSQDEFSFCINAKNLFEIVKELPDAKLELSLTPEKNTLTLRCGHILYELLILSSDEFPKLDFANNNAQFEISSEKLTEIISKTSHAISTDETRIYLNGLFLQEVDSKLRAVATDGHRLSLLETELNRHNIEPLQNGVIIPRKGVSEIKKLVESFPNEVLKICLDESFFSINASDKYFLSVRLIAREYPKYQAVIPQKTTYKLTTDRNSFFDAVRRIKIMSNEKSNGVRIKVFSKEMVISANHPSLGNAEEKIEISYNGKDIEIGFNGKYLLDTLSVFDSGEITMELNNELNPVLVKSPTHPNFLGIIMPLKL